MYKQDPAFLCALAAAYAETGRFDQAIKTTEEALQKARRLNEPELADKVSKCLARYKQQRPYRQNSSIPLLE